MISSFSVDTPIVTRVPAITQSSSQATDLCLHWPVTLPHYQLRHLSHPYTKRFLHSIIISGTLLIPTDCIIYSGTLLIPTDFIINSSTTFVPALTSCLTSSSTQAPFHPYTELLFYLIIKSGICSIPAHLFYPMHDSGTFLSLTY